MQTNTKHNRLIEEESPYLRQHAENPVDWYPWGEEAFKKADREDKPVFLSIGYSTCHWCHVMAEESFEDEKVADLLNENFVSIKVDREERPDIDSIYMQACQLMNGHGGWPLSIFMTPDKKPFYAATYIPKEGRGRRTGMMELLPAISRLWREDRERLLASAEKITEAVRGNGNRGPGGKQELDEKIFSRACSRLEAEYDEENGGFGSSPKFPMNHRLLFLCDFSREEGKNLGEDDSTVEATGEKCERYRAMTEKTLQSMRCGGIYDQLGFGFHRYSTDEKWKVPHFEKMLYDQALLVKAYLAGYQISGREVYAETVKEIIEYVSRDMLSPEGGFYSAEDADSEGVEGKFYLWEKEEIERHLAPEQAEAFIDIFNIVARGNFQEEATGELTGENILYLQDINQAGQGLRESRRKLFSVRDERVHPHKDKKILTDWNGLMVTALARAGFILKNEEYLEMAADTVAFIREEMFTGGRLLHRYGSGEGGEKRAEIGAFLDDYAFLIQGLIELYQASFAVEYLHLALKLQEQLDKYFWDRETGGYYFNAHDAEELLTREKPVYDGVIPSGNSIALWNLVRFFHITGDLKYRDRVEQMVDCFAGSVKNAPTGHLQFLRCCRDYRDSFFSIVIVGEAGASGLEQMKKVLQENYLPNKVVVFKPVTAGDGRENVETVSNYLNDFEMKDGKTTIYVCDNLNCELPTTDVDDMACILRI